MQANKAEATTGFSTISMANDGIKILKTIKQVVCNFQSQKNSHGQCTKLKDVSS
jgi:hypothetical protein